MASLSLPLPVVLALCAVTPGLRAQDPGFELVEVATGVHAVIRTEPSANVAHRDALVIVNDSGVVVDAGGTPAAARRTLAQTRDSVKIETARGTRLEQRGREQLERLLRQYDLRRWTFTRTVRIQSRVIPHSHPVLTLNTRYLEDDTAQVATFLHEQLHWFLAGRPAATKAARADLERLFPKVPVAPPEGARDEESTYLHLLVCLLERDAVAAVFGGAAARRTLARWKHYTWVYREVLERPDPIRVILRAHGLVPPG